MNIKFFHPFKLIGIKTSKLSGLEIDDVYEYGFSLDLTTELSYNTYDWGKGFSFRLLGFGFEVCFLEGVGVSKLDKSKTEYTEEQI